MKSQLYNLIISDVTRYCYKNCLSYFPNNSNILDVGIGNGVMLEKYHHVIKSKNLKLTGIDVNKNYIKHCSRLIRNYNLEHNIEICHQAIESYRPPKDGYFDYILFSMSFMLFIDQRLVLDRIKNYITPNGEIVFFQTMFKERFPLMDFIKPKLKYVTTVDFGRVTYEKEFFMLLNEKNLSIRHDRLIKKEWFKGEYRMIVAAAENVSTHDLSMSNPVRLPENSNYQRI